MEKSFKCQRHLLMRYMKYFEKYLTEVTQVEDIDISVHCDIKIFEWLISYIQQREKKPQGQPGQIMYNKKASSFAAKHSQYRKKTSEERQKEKYINDQSKDS